MGGSVPGVKKRVMTLQVHVHPYLEEGSREDQPQVDRRLVRVRTRCFPDTRGEEAVPGYSQEGPCLRINGAHIRVLSFVVSFGHCIGVEGLFFLFLGWAGFTMDEK